MSFRRVVLPPEAFGQGGKITIRGPAYRHLVRVLRMKPGDLVAVTDGKGAECLARLVAVGPGEALAEMVSARPTLLEPSVEVVLVVGIPKGDKSAMVLQKATELGVARFIMVPTRRSVVRLEAAREPRRRERWQKIAEAAAAQCGRSVVPAVQTAPSLAAALAGLACGTFILMPWEGERARGLREALDLIRRRPPAGVAVLVGPEGGWAEEEVETALAAGAVTVSLGPRILRCETAALVTAALVLYELGDLGVLGGGGVA